MVAVDAGGMRSAADAHHNRLLLAADGRLQAAICWSLIADR